MNRISRVFIPSLFAGLVLACAGGGAPEAESSDDAANAAAESQKKEDDAATNSEESDKASSTSKPEAAPKGPSPREIITSQETAFLLDFIASEIGEKTEEKCRKQAGEDMKKFADCKRKVQDKLGMPMLKFEEKDGSWWWLTYDRRGSDLVVLHQIEFEFGEETANALTILPKGRDKGRKPKSFPSQVVITLPNDNSIELDDPTHGKMVFRARIGILERTEK